MQDPVVVFFLILIYNVLDLAANINVTHGFNADFLKTTYIEFYLIFMIQTVRFIISFLHTAILQRQKSFSSLFTACTYHVARWFRQPPSLLSTSGGAAASQVPTSVSGACQRRWYKLRELQGLHQDDRRLQQYFRLSTSQFQEKKKNNNDNDNNHYHHHFFILLICFLHCDILRTTS